jgi:hypothetical protein
MSDEEPEVVVPPVDVPPRQITETYAYHPADDTSPDLYLPTEVVARYDVSPTRHRPHYFDLERDITDNGILKPVRIYTNGVMGILGDGTQRVRIAQRVGIESIPIQVLPDHLRRMLTQRGAAQLDPDLAIWVEANLWQHAEHEVSRKVVGGGPSMGVTPNRYIRCTCSCNATWKEG